MIEKWNIERVKFVSLERRPLPRIEICFELVFSLAGISFLNLMETKLSCRLLLIYTLTSSAN